MPPSLEKLHQYSPSWAESEAVSSNFGVLYDARIGGFTVDLAAFRSIFDIDRTDYTLISADAAGHASATTFRNPDRTKRSDSAEARVGRQFEAGGLSHLATVSLRGGRTTVDLTSNLAIPLGAFDLRERRSAGRTGARLVRDARQGHGRAGHRLRGLRARVERPCPAPLRRPPDALRQGRAVHRRRTDRGHQRDHALQRLGHRQSHGPHRRVRQLGDGSRGVRRCADVGDQSRRGAAAGRGRAVRAGRAPCHHAGADLHRRRCSMFPSPPTAFAPTARSGWWARCATAASRARSQASWTQRPASSWAPWPSSPR